MVSSVLALGTACVFHAAFVLEIDFGSVPPPGQRPAALVYHLSLRLRSGHTIDFSEQAGTATADEMCDRGVEWCCKVVAHRRDGRRLKVYELADGDPVVGVVQSQALAAGLDGKPVPFPGLVYRWVPRVSPPEPEHFVLTAGPRGGGLFGRAVAIAFAAAITVVVAPELDFEHMPAGDKRPRVYKLIVAPTLAPDLGRFGPAGSDIVVHHKKTIGDLVDDVLGVTGNYDTWRDPLRPRVALLEYENKVAGEGTTRHRVIGLEIWSYGPRPAVRWTLRPEVRKLLQKK